jgi:hypothetical protein
MGSDGGQAQHMHMSQRRMSMRITSGCENGMAGLCPKAGRLGKPYCQIRRMAPTAPPNHRAATPHH